MLLFLDNTLVFQSNFLNLPCKVKVKKKIEKTLDLSREKKTIASSYGSKLLHFLRCNTSAITF